MDQGVCGRLPSALGSLSDPPITKRLEADIDKLGKRLDESVLVLPFTELSNDAALVRKRVKEARTEVEVRVTSTETAILLISPT